MRKIVLFLFIILMSGFAMAMLSCGGGGSTGATGDLIADFDLEGEEYLADPDTPIERLAEIFSSRPANAYPDLGFHSNSFPFNIFTGDKPVQAGLEVVVIGPDQSFVAQTTVGPSGHVSFSELPTGFLRLNITGQDGNTYQAPIQISESTTSRTRILVYRAPLSGDVKISSKTIHDNDNDGMNDDDFSYALFGRPRNTGTGGLIHFHADGITHVDTNGDGVFDSTVTEADDDGVSSSEGDGDEDNDGERDDVDLDIDGDGIINSQDEDIDGDGLMNEVDPFPNGTSPEDDYDPPTLPGPIAYTGIIDLEQIDTDTVTVFFKPAEDISEPVRYNIYWSTTSPIDFSTAYRQMFTPLQKPTPDQILQDNVIGLSPDITYYFTVRAQDSAQPPNEDTNSNEFDIVLQ